ncbi:hypothetical protein C8R46DRAFT_809056, partial [Mycena filopes]
EMRYKPEYTWLSIVPGRHEADVDAINHYSRPLIDVFEAGWKRGIHISPTGRSPAGRDVDLAVVISVNDLPAARKISGAAGTKSNFFCTVCNLYHQSHVWDSDFENWTRRDVDSLRESAYAYKNADTLADRDNTFKDTGVRWSEFWRLPYWDPTRMLVIDAMHCVLEGIVQYHCRRILCLDLEVAKGKEVPMAFSYNWRPYDDTKFSETEVRGRHVEKIQTKLEEAIAPAVGEPGTDAATIEKVLKSTNIPPLRHVTEELGLLHRLPAGEKPKKEHYIKVLLEWVSRLGQRHTDPDFVPKPINEARLRAVQRVIAKTITPAWINSVPSNYGEANAGTIKADEWRLLATLYIPIALVLMWGDQPQYDAQRVKEMLEHSMALFQAVVLVCRNSSSQERSAAYRQYIKEWVDGIAKNHPHAAEHNARINIHAAFHIYDFLILFGPIMAWWCFPFERLIGTLQKINTNNHIGGELEATIVKSFWRGANLRRYLNRSDCPEVIKQFKILFDLSFSPRNDRSVESAPHEKEKDRANYTHQGVNYSRSSTHLGNSLVIYYPSANAPPIPGSIQRIQTDGDKTVFHIQRQAPLPSGKFDPFLPFPHFPAKTYSSLMENTVDKVAPSSVLAHCARYDFTDDRAVIVNL